MPFCARWLSARAAPPLVTAALAVVLLLGSCRVQPDAVSRHDAVERLVREHARAWENGDTAALNRIFDDDAVVAYPQRRLDKAGWIQDLAEFSQGHTDTRIYIHTIVVDGPDFAVEWQFASTTRASGVRTAVSDAIVGRVTDGRIGVWKEYLDGRVTRLQADGRLGLDEGLPPFPWPTAK